MTNIFDTHAHYASRQFDGDRADLLAALSRGGVVGVLECATHSGDAQKVLELAHTAPYFHAALGIHPESLIEEDAATVAVYHGDWRAELAAMLAQFAEKKSAAIYFSDVSAGYWAANAIALTANLGWINGYPDGTFGPDKTVTRAELMAMVNRATGRAPESTGALLSGMKTWKDNADTARWYYLDVQEATNSHTYLGAPTETWTSLTATPDWSQYE